MEEEINKVNLINNRQSSHPEYQTITKKGKDVENEMVLSSLQDDVFLTKYVSTYLEVKIQDIGDKEIWELYDTFFSEGALNEDHKDLEDSTLAE